LERVVNAANGDMRQVGAPLLLLFSLLNCKKLTNGEQILNNLEMWSLTNKTLGAAGAASVDQEMKDSVKYSKQNPFEFTPLFFSRGT
jgi:hypothetical protein